MDCIIQSNNNEQYSLKIYRIMLAYVQLKTRVMPEPESEIESLEYRDSNLKLPKAPACGADGFRIYPNNTRLKLPNNTRPHSAQFD